MARNFAIFLGVLALTLLAVRSYQKVSLRNELAVATPTALPSATAAPRSPTATLAPGKVRVVLDEQEVNRLLVQGLATTNYQFEDLKVTLEEGRIVATASQQISFVKVPVTVIAAPVVVDGQVTISPVSISTAGFSLPQQIVDDLSATMRSQLASSIAALPIKITGIQVHPGQLVVEGTPK